MLRCPFCSAEEDERLEGVDEDGRSVILLIFNCPFFMKVPRERFGSDEQLQDYLFGWRKREGDEWLESVGPVLKLRELRNIERSKTRYRELS
jgi:hypothetical protein